VLILFKGEIMKKIMEMKAAEGGDDAKLFVVDLANAYMKLFGALG